MPCSKGSRGPLDLVLPRALSLPLCGWLELDSELSSLSITQSHLGHTNGHCLECGSVVPALWGADDHFNTHLLAVTHFTANAASWLSGEPHWGPSSPAFGMGIWGTLTALYRNQALAGEESCEREHSFRFHVIMIPVI